MCSHLLSAGIVEDEVFDKGICIGVYDIHALHTSQVLCECHGVHPCMQVVRSRLQQRQAHNRAVQYRDGFATLRLILRREGAAGLYKGLVPNVLRVMPQAAITFLVYEQIMRLLETQVVQRWTTQ